MYATVAGASNATKQDFTYRLSAFLVMGKKTESFPLII